MLRRLGAISFSTSYLEHKCAFYVVADARKPEVKGTKNRHIDQAGIIVSVRLYYSVFLFCYTLQEFHRHVLVDNKGVLFP